MSTPVDLSKIMEFDHVIRVHADGTVTDAPGTYAPEVYIDTDDDGQILARHEAAYLASAKSQGWELMRGYTGQYSYAGPIMHPSEYIGGGLADDILTRPGVYVALEVRSLEGDDDPIGWVTAYREE